MLFKFRALLFRLGLPRHALGLLMIFVISGCASPLASRLGGEVHSQSLIERLEHEAPSGTDHEPNAESNLTIDSLLTEIDAVQVQTLIESQPFQTLARTGEITQYPCSSCHIEPLAELQAIQRQSDPKAHWDIAIEHADESVMRCTTCHSPDDMDSLHTLTGDTVAFDHSYQVCAQCHSGMAKDWVGGAHGKRIGGWAPPRVVNNCVDCHSPHQPVWDMRWPAVTNGGSSK